MDRKYKLFLKFGTTDFNSVMLEAAREGNEEVFWSASEFVTEIDQAMAEAANRGHKNIVRMCKLHGATDFDTAMCSTASMGHAKIIKLCAKYGATDFH